MEVTGIVVTRCHCRIKLPTILGGFETHWREYLELPIDGEILHLQNIRDISLSATLCRNIASGGDGKEVGEQEDDGGPESLLSRLCLILWYFPKLGSALHSKAFQEKKNMKYEQSKAAARSSKKEVNAQIFRFSPDRMHCIHGFERAPSGVMKMLAVTIKRVADVDKVLLRLEDGDGERGALGPSRKGTTISRIAI